MDMNTLGYFIYMDQTEKKQEEEKEQRLKVNVESEDDLENDQTTTDD